MGLTSRLIDIWNIWNVSQVVAVILFHILVNNLKPVYNPRPKSSGFKAYVGYNIRQPQRLNSIAKVVFPLLYVAFIVVYFLGNYYYEEHHGH